VIYARSEVCALTDTDRSWMIQLFSPSFAIAYARCCAFFSAVCRKKSAPRGTLILRWLIFSSGRPHRLLCTVYPHTNVGIYDVSCVRRGPLETRQKLDLNYLNFYLCVARKTACFISSKLGSTMRRGREIGRHAKVSVVRFRYFVKFKRVQLF